LGWDRESRGASLSTREATARFPQNRAVPRAPLIRFIFAMNVPSLLHSIVGLTLILAVTATAQEQPVLERYTLGVGQNSDGVATALRDKHFGGGDARASLAYFDTTRRQDPTGKTGVLFLHVARFVPPGTIAFALLCFGIEVRGFDSADTLVYSQDLPGFTFGDSKSGRFSRVLREIPLSVARLEVTFFGNYE
jgi:hypothetical protein